MNTKEAISCLKNNKHETLWRAKIPKIQNKNMDDIIELLQRGEKYEAMWEEFKFKRGDTYTILEQPEKGTIRDDMNEFEEKHLKGEKFDKGK